MPTPIKKWPHESDWARLDSIALAGEGLRALATIIELTHDARTLRVINIATKVLYEIQKKLTAVGAKAERPSPEDVFEKEELEKWALENGFCQMWSTK